MALTASPASLMASARPSSGVAVMRVLFGTRSVAMSFPLNVLASDAVRAGSLDCHAFGMAA